MLCREIRISWLDLVCIRAVFSCTPQSFTICIIAFLALEIWLVGGADNATVAEIFSAALGRWMMIHDPLFHFFINHALSSLDTPVHADDVPGIWHFGDDAHRSRLCLLVIVLRPSLADNTRVVDSKSELELDMACVELPVPPYLLLLLALPVVFLALSRGKDARHRLRLPPGPWALPVIGHLHHLAGAPPHRALRDLARRHGQLMALRFCELPVVVVSSPAAAVEIMKTHDATFASRPVGPMLQLVFQGAPGVIFAPYGEGWRQLRRICSLELLSARRVHSFRCVRESELGRLLRSVASAAAVGAPVNLAEQLRAFTADSTVRAIVGSRSEHRDAFLRLLYEVVKIMPGLTLPDLFPSSRLAMLVSRVPGKIERRRTAMFSIIEPIIKDHQDRRAAGGVDEDEDEDFLDVLLRLQEDMGSQDPLTTANIKSIIFDLFSAGSDTTAITLQWAMAELMRNPAVMRKAQDEVRRVLASHGKVTEDSLATLHYLRLVIKETLRLHPPAPLLIPRECRSLCQILGYDVPEGTMVLVNAWAIGRDPAHWEAPEDFAPERFERTGRDFKGLDFEFIPFGAGRRMCPGVAFGLVHVELALAALLWHFDWKLPDGMVPEEMDMAEAVGVTVPRRSDLVLVAVPRMPVPMD